ncbi:MAG: Ig-like domain-containing protein [Nitrospirota bacterium]
MSSSIRFLFYSFLAFVVVGCAQTADLIKGASLTRLTLTPSQQVLALGEEVVFTAESVWSNGEKRDVTQKVKWQSSDRAIATFFNLGGQERALAVGVGTSTISALFESLEQTALIVVTPSPIKALKINATQTTIEMGQQQAFTVAGIMGNGLSQDLTLGVLWSSSDKNVAVISPTGQVTALSAGVTSIAAASGTIHAGVQLTVSAPLLKKIEVAPNHVSVPAGLSHAFGAKGFFSNETTETLTDSVTWKSSDSSMVAMNKNGVATAVAKQVKKPQSAIITATVGNVTQTASITVTPPNLVKIAVTPGNASLASGKTQQLIAEGILSDQTTEALTDKVAWHSSNPSILTVDKNGLAKGLGIGSVTVTADFGKQTGTTMVTITPADLTEIRVTPAIPFVAAGLTQLFSAEGSFTDGAVRVLKENVVWSSSEPSAVTINAEGLAKVFAKSVEKPRAITITAALGKISGKAKMTITPPELTQIDVTPAIPFVAAGKVQQFKAEGLLTDDTTESLPTGVKWSSSDPFLVTINKEGLAKVIAKGLKNSQAVMITATLEKISGKAKLTVTPPEISTLAVTPAIPFVAVGRTVQFKAETVLTDETRQSPVGVVWSSSDQSAVTIDPVTGFATALLPRTVTITADLGTIKNTAKLTVTEAELNTMRLFPEAPVIMVGKTLALAARGHFSDGTEKVPADLIWSSSDLAISTIDRKTGLVTAISPGKVTMTATAGLVQSTVPLTIVAPELLSIRIVPEQTTVIVGKRLQFSAEGKFSDGETRPILSDLTWSSSEPAILSMQGITGLATALSMGEAVITASSGTTRTTTVLSVMIPKLTKIEIRADRTSIAAGQSLKLSATGSFTDDLTRPLASDITWSSADPFLLEIRDGGVATAIGKGIINPKTVMVTATSLPESDGQMIVSTIRITVTPPELMAIELTPGEASFVTGQTQSFHAAGLFTDGTTQVLTSELLQWQSSNPAIAAIDENGFATALIKNVETPRQVMISALSGGITGKAKLTVTPPELIEVRVIPNEGTVAAGRSFSFSAEGLFSDGTKKPLPTQVEWSTSSPNLATVNGQVGLTDTHAMGVVTVTAVSGKIKGTARLNVTAPELIEVQVMPKKTSVASGQTRQFTLMGRYSDKKERAITTGVQWSSSDSSVATIDENGLVTSASRGVDSPLTVRITVVFEKGSDVAILTVTPTP